MLQNPSPKQSKFVEHCLHQLVVTEHLALQYDGLAQEQRIFGAHSDSALTDNIGDRYSPYGFCFSVYGGSIYWKATMSMIVITSSAETELLAIKFTARNFIRCIRFFSHLNFNLQE